MNYFNQFEKYNLSIFKNGARLPEIKISDGEKTKLGLSVSCSNKDYLKTLAWNGYLEKSKLGLISKSREECIQRLKFEFEVFDKTGTIDYILLLMKIFLWCDQNDIPRGPSRGSAGGSFALYLLDLIYINPLDHDLNFTRFLNEARAKPKYLDGVLYVDGKTFADFDGDVSNIGRGKLVENIEKVFHGKTCKILTIQYLTGKTALKDTIKSYLEYSEQDSLEITNNIESLFGKVDSLAKTLEKNKTIQEWVKESDKNQEAFAIAKKIEGLIRGVGQHASGVFLSYCPVEDIVPTELSAKENEIVAGYDMEVVLTLGLKADVLGLKTLDYIKTAADLVGINFQKINVNDQSIYDYFASNNLYYGLFQVEDGLTKSVVAKVKPKNIDQLAACISISRPGALKHIDEYVKYVNNGERKLIYPEIDKVLEQTGGIILYQEQINRICQEVYKLSPTDSDEIRRAIGKKQKDEMAKWEPILYVKGKENNISDVITKWFWDTCNASADYLFNASHCLSPDTIIETKDGYKMMIDTMAGEFIRAFNVERQTDEYVKVLNIVENEKELFEVELEDGRKISASLDHKFLCDDMQMHTLEQIITDNLNIITD